MPRQDLADTGHSYDIVSPAGGAIPLDEKSTTSAQLADPPNVRCLADPAFERALLDSAGCADVDPDDYAAIYLAGGHGIRLALYVMLAGEEFEVEDPPELSDALRELGGRIRRALRRG